jgi:hypothetical protein
MKNFKNIISSLLLISFLTSCVNDRKDKNVDDNAQENKKDVVTEEKPVTIPNIPWSAELDTNTQVFTMKKNEQVKTQDLDSSNVLKAINKDYPQNLIVWERLSGDTAYVNIPNSASLTQQSGTLGAKVFLAESTYSITEIPGIKVVNFNFKTGDHASPGAYTRSDFNFSMP